MAGVDWVGDKAGEWTNDRIEEQQERERLRARLGEIEPMCGSDFKPDGFAVSEGQAIALVARGRDVDCDLVDTEPMDDGLWAVHVDAKGSGGCEFSAEVNGKTGKVSNRHRDCG